jgi:hypothetical protein
LFEAAGYRLEERPPGLLAIRARDHRAVLVLAEASPPPDVEGEFPPDAVHRTLVYADDPGPVVRALAADRGMEVLDSTTLGPAIGELLLLPAENARGLVPPEDADDLAMPEPISPTGDLVIRPRLGEAEAVALSGVEGSRYLLRLVPFYLAPYRVRVPTPHGNRGPVTQHLVGVNAISGRVEVWEEGERELVDELEGPFERLAAVRSEQECLLLADTELRKRHTVEVDHVEQHAGAVVIERRRVPPGVKDLRIGRPVLVHVPYWYVESVGGRVVLDAVTGRRLGPLGEDTSDSLAP